MDIRMKYHKDWYYDRDEEIEKKEGYDLYVGFAESADVLKQGSPYPIEFFIIPSDVKFSYARYLKTMAQRDNKKYVLRSSSFDDRKIAAKMAESFEFISSSIETSEDRDKIIKHVCVDSDNGKDYFEKGKVEINSNFMTDFCSKDELLEFYCSDDNWNMEKYICPNGCEDGACLK